MSTPQITPQQLSKSLITHLKAGEKEPGESERLQGLYGFVEGVQPQQAVQRFFREAWDAEYFPLFLNSELNYGIERSPLLVKLEARHQNYLLNSALINNGHSLWFLSPCSLADQIPFWQSLIFAFAPHGERVLHRYWDGFIAAGYAHSLRPDELGELYSPASILFTPSRDGWYQRRLTSKSMLPNHTRTWWHIRESHLSPFQEQFDAITEDDILDQLWRQHPELVAQIYPPLRSEVVRSGKSLARSLHLKSEANIVRFIALQLTYQADFWRAPKWQAVWKQGNAERLFSQMTWQWET